jgi:hypothetical protein
LAVLALSQASLDAFSLASKADMRAWAMTKASASKEKDITNL